MSIYQQYLNTKTSLQRDKIDSHMSTNPKQLYRYGDMVLTPLELVDITIADGFSTEYIKGNPAPVMGKPYKGYYTIKKHANDPKHPTMHHSYKVSKIMFDYANYLKGVV